MLPRYEPQQRIEPHAVQQVRERIGIEHALRLAAAPDVAFEPAEPAVRPEPEAPHPRFHGDRDQDDREDAEEKRSEANSPGTPRIRLQAHLREGTIHGTT